MKACILALDRTMAVKEKGTRRPLVACDSDLLWWWNREQREGHHSMSSTNHSTNDPVVSSVEEKALVLREWTLALHYGSHTETSIDIAPKRDEIREKHCVFEFPALSGAGPGGPGQCANVN